MNTYLLLVHIKVEKYKKSIRIWKAFTIIPNMDTCILKNKMCGTYTNNWKVSHQTSFEQAWTRLFGKAFSLNLLLQLLKQFDTTVTEKTISHGTTHRIAKRSVCTLRYSTVSYKWFLSNLPSNLLPHVIAYSGENFCKNRNQYL